MTWTDIGIQALGFIPSFIALTSLQSPNRKKILVLQFFCNFMWLSHYLLLGATTAAMTNVVGILRAVLCYYNDKEWVNKKWVPFALSLLYVGGTVLTWGGFSSIFPCIAMIMTTFALWSHNMKLTRLLFLLNSPFMLACDLLTGSYACAIIEVLAFISFAVAVYRYDIRPNRKAEAAPAGSES